MELSQNTIDALVYQVIAGCQDWSPPLSREEIYTHVLDQLCESVSKYVDPSIQRMIETGAISEDRDTLMGRPLAYRIATPVVEA